MNLLALKFPIEVAFFSKCLIEFSVCELNIYVSQSSFWKERKKELLTSPKSFHFLSQSKLLTFKIQMLQILSGQALLQPTTEFRKSTETTKIGF